MDSKKHFKMFMVFISFLFFAFFCFVFVSAIFSIKRIVENGGIYSFNSGDLIGHLLILLIIVGCLYFSIKTSLLM